MRVLMLDDHLMFLQGLKNLLNVLAPNLNVDTASRLADGLQMAASTSYDLVLLDWHLDDDAKANDGTESMRRLREVGCAARIVVLSGETKPSLIRQTSLRRAKQLRYQTGCMRICTGSSCCFIGSTYKRTKVAAPTAAQYACLSQPTGPPCALAAVMPVCAANKRVMPARNAGWSMSSEIGKTWRVMSLVMRNTS